MKKLIVALVSMACLAAAPAWAADVPPYDKANAAADGHLIAEILDNANRPKEDMITYAVMTLKSGNDVTDTRKVIVKRKTYGNVDRALMRFMDSLKRGVTFLTIEHKGADNEQYLYLPSMGRPRQIASADRQADFEDTDLTNEDLGGRKVEDYTYQRRGDTKINDKPVYKVVAQSKDPDARFPKYMVWIDQETFVPVQVKVYNKDNKLQKVMAAGDIQKVDDVYIPYKTVVKDFLRDHTTIMVVKEAKANIGLSGVEFDKNKMGSKWSETF